MNIGTFIRAAIVLLATVGLMVLRARTIKQAIPVVVLGLVLSIVLLGQRRTEKPARWLRFRSPEDFAWLLVAVLTLVAIFLD